MSQSTLDDDELFSEAATEIRGDVEEALSAARDALPDEDEIWEIDGENTLGVLNALRSSLDVGDAVEHLRDAKKWYTMGERADAFEDAEDLESELETVEELIESIETAREQVGDLASTLPELRNELAASGDAEDSESE